MSNPDYLTVVIKPSASSGAYGNGQRGLNADGRGSQIVVSVSPKGCSRHADGEQTAKSFSNALVKVRTCTLWT